MRNFLSFLLTFLLLAPVAAQDDASNTAARADFDNSGLVGAADLVAFLSVFGFSTDGEPWDVSCSQYLELYDPSVYEDVTVLPLNGGNVFFERAVAGCDDADVIQFINSIVDEGDLLSINGQVFDEQMLYGLFDFVELSVEISNVSEDPTATPQTYLVERYYESGDFEIEEIIVDGQYYYDTTYYFVSGYGVDTVFVADFTPPELYLRNGWNALEVPNLFELMTEVEAILLDPDNPYCPFDDSGGEGSGGGGAEGPSDNCGGEIVNEVFADLIMAQYGAALEAVAFESILVNDECTGDEVPLMWMEVLYMVPPSPGSGDQSGAYVCVGAEDGFYNQTSRCFFINFYPADPHCIWYLPPEGTNEPAWCGYDPPAGYVYAEARECVLHVMSNDPYCIQELWDSWCWDDYETCAASYCPTVHGLYLDTLSITVAPEHIFNGTQVFDLYMMPALASASVILIPADWPNSPSTAWIDDFDLQPPTLLAPPIRYVEDNTVKWHYLARFHVVDACGQDQFWTEWVTLTAHPAGGNLGGGFGMPTTGVGDGADEASGAVPDGD